RAGWCARCRPPVRPRSRGSRRASRAAPRSPESRCSRGGCASVAVQPVRYAGTCEQLRGLEQRQAHDARVAAREVLDEHCTVALHGIAAGFVARLAGVPVGDGFGEAEVTETDLTAAEAMIHLTGRREGYRGQHLMAAA